MSNEKLIEENFIQKLKDLCYVYRDDIKDRNALEKNFRQKFETLNKVHLTDNEFVRLLGDIVKSDVFTVSKILRERNTFIREDGTPLQYVLVNIKDWCRNTYEVVNQLRINTSNSYHRYDVMLLINGIPVVQIELKSLEVTPRRAMQQIVEYKNDNGNGYTNTLLCFIQLFIVSNQSNTYYFCNNNNQHFNFNADEKYIPVYKWADENNNKISRLDKFADCFLRKCTLGEMISKYMVLVACERKLLMMRPYQIYAAKAMVDCIEQNRGNGYIWHTTGSGKTLTSFKASTLLRDNPNIDKCFFVVDRKDLDKQTRDEFNKFQSGCVEENTNTETLVRRMLSLDYADKIIVTTIQKLGIALDPSNKNMYKKQLEEVRNDRVVFIFDECHRSQFGDNHKAIKEFFPNSQLFGFTGTPIFEDNASYTRVDGVEASYVTTKDVFEKELHSYTITNAIDDQNVLRFHVDYFKPGNFDLRADGVVKKKAVVDAIIAKHDAATNSRVFNALFATASINDAIEYYALFNYVQQERLKCDPDYQPINIACVFSPPAFGNKDILQIQEDLPQEELDNQSDSENKRTELQNIIDGYNAQYGTNFNVNDFDKYYQDIQKRIKDQQYSNHDYPHSNKIDITIVVDMLLTGFDSKYLNTLYVDKDLRWHGLIQAFSRTNRILNDTKPYGNILDFRQQRDEVDKAIGLFSGVDLDKAKKIWLVDSAPVMIEKYREAVERMIGRIPEGNVACEPEAVYNLQGDAAHIDFINKFKEIQRIKTKLDQYTDLTDEQRESIDAIMSPEQLMEYRCAYIEYARHLKEKQFKDKEKLSETVQSLDFEFVLFASSVIDYDYIMGLIANYTSDKKKRITREQLVNIIRSNANLMDESDDIIAYIDTLSNDQVNGRTENEIREGYLAFKNEKFDKEIKEIAERHGLTESSLKEFVEDIIVRMIFDGEKLDVLLEPFDLGWKARVVKENNLMRELVPVLKKHVGGQEISGLSAYEE